MKQKRFANFWWDSGTPSFLIKKLKEGFHFDLDNLKASNVMFESFTLENINWLALLFQTGYLTIQSYDEGNRLYTLDYPNLEVQDTMHQHLLAAFRGTLNTDSLPILVTIKEALEKKELERFIRLINSLFSTIPYQIFLEKVEAFFHAILHLSFSGIGLLTRSEVSTSQGRVDTVVETDQYIYIMEFKLNATADAALTQIRKRRYGSPYLNEGKEVVALGISFGSQEKSVTDWKAVPYASLLVDK